MVFPFQPMPLGRRAAPFDHPEWVFEVKHDGFRAIAYVKAGHCELVSRRGYVYKRFLALAEQIAENLDVQNAVLDGEIVCLDGHGKSHFKTLLYRRGTPYFYAFDILELHGKDLRALPLVTRKRQLKRIVPSAPSALLYVDHIEERGEELFQLACREDLEGIVAKWKNGLYDAERVSSWVKIKNPGYSQMLGRQELFDRRNSRAGPQHLNTQRLFTRVRAATARPTPIRIASR